MIINCSLSDCISILSPSLCLLSVGASELVSRGCTAIAVVVRFPEDEEIDTVEVEEGEKEEENEGKEEEEGEDCNDLSEEQERLLWQIQLDNERKEKENLTMNALVPKHPVAAKASPSLSPSPSPSSLVSDAQAAAAARFQAYRQGEVRT